MQKINSPSILVFAMTGYLIDLPLFAHLQGHYVLTKHYMNRQSFFSSFFPTSIYNSTTKPATQNVSTRGYLFQVVKETVLGGRGEISLKRSIAFYYNIALSGILSCGYLSFDRNIILQFSLRP